MVNFKALVPIIATNVPIIPQIPTNGVFNVDRISIRPSHLFFEKIIMEYEFNSASKSGKVGLVAKLCEVFKSLVESCLTTGM